MKIEARKRPKPVEAVRPAEAATRSSWQAAITKQGGMTWDYDGKLVILVQVPSGKKGAFNWERLTEDRWLVLYDDGSVRVFHDVAFQKRFKGL